jgi:hypothetical protein
MTDSDKIKNLEDDIKDKLKIIASVNKLKDFMTVFLKKIFKDTADTLKTLFGCLTVEEFRDYFV